MELAITQDDLTLFSVPLIALMVVFEVIYGTRKQQPIYSTKETLTNFYLTTLAIVINIIMRGFYVWVYGFFYTLHIFQIDYIWVYWVSLLVIQDFLFYWLHYFDHYSRFFWAVHVTHHSSTEYNFTTGFRSSVFQPMYRFLYYIPLACIGFRPLDIMLMYSATQIWGIFIHTTSIKRLPSIIEFLFVTPSHHRVHHGSNVRYLDKNMGMFLIIWDRLFGTFQKEIDSDPVTYGLTSNPKNRGPVNIVFHEFKAIGNDLKKNVNWKDKLKYIFYPPGWSHDKSTLTAKELRKHLSQKNDTPQIE